MPGDGHERTWSVMGGGGGICVYIYICVYVYVCVCIYIYIYRKRRPEGPVFAGFMIITILILYPSL